MLRYIKGKKVLVLGLGKSGLSSAKLLLDKGAGFVLASDSRKENELGKEVKELSRDSRVELVCGGHPDSLLNDISVIIKSPGINPRLPFLLKAEQAGIPVFSEVELAYSFSPAPIVGVTGTNGKTTTTSMIGEMFKRKYQEVFVAGNIGFPLCDAAGKAKESDWIVAELSSFQLDHTKDFKARIAAVLNITPDHLDYHRSMEHYISSKKKILHNQDPGDWAILNWDDPLVRGFASSVQGKLLYFSIKEAPEPGVFVEKGKVVIKENKEKIEICSVEEIGLPGKHNKENALSAVAVSWAAGVGKEDIALEMKEFPGVPHRLEAVEEINGVLFINDSKGTNPEAAVKAFQAFHGPKIIIAGGLDKGAEFSSMLNAMKTRELKKIIVLGETASKIEKAAGEAGIDDIEKVESIEKAVERAYLSSSRGDRVLLSPACASWDMFNNYEERGDAFKRAVLALKEGRSNEKSIR